MLNILFFILTVLYSIFPAVFEGEQTLVWDNGLKQVDVTQTAEEPQASAAQTEATPAPTPTPVTGPSATPWMSEDATAALNQKIQDFLNKEGDFTPEKISAKMFDLSGVLDTSKMQLGLVDATHIEGYFFDYIEKDGSLLLLVGFDGNDGDRFVVPIQIPLYFIESDLTSHFYFVQYNSGAKSLTQKADITQLDIAGLNQQLYGLIDKCIAFAPARIPLSAASTGYSGRAKTYFLEHNDKINRAEQLMLVVCANEENIAASMTFPQIYDVRNSIDINALEGVTLPHIMQLSDLANVDLATVPMIDPAIIYGK
ncbi:MAG: hypothetical protein ABFC73_04870 [Clostridiaceae bacterium]